MPIKIWFALRPETGVHIRAFNQTTSSASREWAKYISTMLTLLYGFNMFRAWTLSLACCCSVARTNFGCAIMSTFDSPSVLCCVAMTNICGSLREKVGNWETKQMTRSQWNLRSTSLHGLNNNTKCEARILQECNVNIFGCASTRGTPPKMLFFKRVGHYGGIYEYKFLLQKVKCIIFLFFGTYTRNLFTPIFSLVSSLTNILMVMLQIVGGWLH